MFGGQYKGFALKISLVANAEDLPVEILLEANTTHLPMQYFGGKYKGFTYKNIPGGPYKGLAYRYGDIFGGKYKGFAYGNIFGRMYN